MPFRAAVLRWWHTGVGKVWVREGMRRHRPDARLCSVLAILARLRAAWIAVGAWLVMRWVPEASL